MDDRATGTSLAEVQYAISLRPRAGALARESIEDLHLRRMTFVEELHEPYRIDLEIVTDDVALELDALVGADASLTIERPESDAHHADPIERLVHGVVLAVDHIGLISDRLHVRLRIGPALALLRNTTRCRIFQGESVPDLVKRIVEEALAPYERTVDLSHLQGEHPPRDYCVQHRETDLAFVQRVLAEEGISLVFAADDARETIVLVDEVAAFPPIASAAEADGDARLVAIGGDRSELLGEETITGFAWHRRMRPAATRTTAWDWKSLPTTVMFGELTRDPSPADFGEVYAPDERRTSEGADGRGPHEDRVDEIAAHRFAAIEAQSSNASGESNVTAFTAGHTFELDDPDDSGVDPRWLLLRVTHEADCPEADIHASGAGAGANYENHFHAVPASRDFRPAPRAKPRIYGNQLATVVGPSTTEDIHTDEHGRIKVWFHWDREGRGADPDTSCWLRVAQLWAGSGFGAMFIPRVGMEVVVSFIDGDPDRPLCVGCVYDGANRPPWTLPEERTKSGIKTKSSPNGVGFNELRFEDAKGSEEVFLHAERDLKEKVKRAHSMSVGATQTLTVGSDQTEKVGGDRKVTIKGNETIFIEGTPPNGAPMGQEITVIGDIKASATKTYSLVAPMGIDLICGPTVISMTPTGITLTAGSGAVIKLDAALAAMAAGGAVSLGMDASGKASLGTSTGALLEMQDAVKMSSNDGNTIELKRGATISAQAGARITLTKDAEMSGAATVCKGNNAKLQLAAGEAVIESQKAAIATPGGKLLADAQSLKLTAPQVATTAAALATTLAPLIKHN